MQRTCALLRKEIPPLEEPLRVIKKLPQQRLRIAFREECKREVAVIDQTLYVALKGCKRLPLYQMKGILQDLGVPDEVNDDDEARAKIREALGVARSEIPQEAWDGDWGALQVNLQKVAQLYIRSIMEEMDSLPERSAEMARKSVLPTSDPELLDALTDLKARKAFAACTFECVREKLEERFPRQVESKTLEVWVIDQLTEAVQDKAVMYLDLEARVNLRHWSDLTTDEKKLGAWLKEQMAHWTKILPVQLPFRVTLSCGTPHKEDDLYALVYPSVQRSAAEIMKSRAVEIFDKELRVILEKHRKVIMVQGFAASPLTQDLAGQSIAVEQWIETARARYSELLPQGQYPCVYPLLGQHVSLLRDEVVRVVEGWFKEEFRTYCAPYHEDASKMSELVRRRPIYIDLMRLKERDPVKKEMFTAALLEIIKSTHF